MPSVTSPFLLAQPVAAAGSARNWSKLVAEPSGAFAWSRGGLGGAERVLGRFEEPIVDATFSASGDALAVFVDADGAERGSVGVATEARPEPAWVPSPTPLAVRGMAVADGGNRVLLLVESPAEWQLLLAERHDGFEPRAVHLSTRPIVGIAASENLGDIVMSVGEGGRVDALIHLSLSGTVHRDFPGFINGRVSLQVAAVRNAPTPVALLSWNEEHGMAAATWNLETGALQARTVKVEGASQLNACDIRDDGLMVLIAWKDAEACLVTSALASPPVVHRITGAISRARWDSETTVSALWSDAVVPMTMASIDVISGRATPANGAPAPAHETPTARSMKLRSADGLVFQSWSFEPSGPIRGVVIDIHGGPRDLVTNQFVPERSAWVAAGWAVVCPNYRGSIGFGTTFEQLNAGSGGESELLDIEAAVDHARAMYGNELPRILTGWSYGGYLALMASIRSPGAANGTIATLPIVDWVEQSRTSSAELRDLQIALFGAERTEEERQDLYRRRSPLHNLERISRPTLISYALGDVRCPASAVEEMRRRALQSGSPVSFQEVPGGHVSVEWDLPLRKALFETHLDFARGVTHEG